MYASYHNAADSSSSGNVYTMGLQPFYGKRLHPVLWACTRVACEKIAVSSLLNHHRSYWV